MKNILNRLLENPFRETKKKTLFVFVVVTIIYSVVLPFIGSILSFFGHKDFVFEINLDVFEAFMLMIGYLSGAGVADKFFNRTKKEIAFNNNSNTEEDA